MKHVVTHGTQSVYHTYEYRLEHSHSYFSLKEILELSNYV